MQMVSEVMTRDIRFVSPQENLQRAAQMMDELNVGALPVCDGERLVGMVTDRDITVRATAAGRAPTEAHVEDVMSTDVRWCFEDQDVDDVMQQMANTQIRRVPVVSHDDAHKLVGIVSLGDLATKTAGGAQKQDVERTMEKVSSPSEPDRSPSPGASRPTGNATAGAKGLAASGVSSRTGSDTGTATGLAGSDMLDTAGEEAHAEAGSGAGSPDSSSTDTGATSGLSARRDAGSSGPSGARGGQDAGGPQPGMAGPGTGGNTLGAAGTAGTSSGVNAPIAGAAGDAAPAGAAGVGNPPDAVRDTGAPGGIDAAGPSGASGGVAGSGGAGAATGKGKKR